MAIRLVKKGGGAQSALSTESGARRVSPARRAAFEVLRRVEDEGAFAAVLLASTNAELRADDRALCYELVLGVLRRQLWLDKLIEHYAAGRAAASLDAPVRRALRLGLYQLRFLARIPQSAAVNESVNFAYEARLRSAANFINAVLRRATREPHYDPATQATDELERLSIDTSHPAWLLARWIKFFGAEEAEAFAHANNQTPPVAFRINPLRAPVAEVMERLRAMNIEVKSSQIASGAWRIEGTGGALVRELAAAGVIYMQDEASQLIAHLLEAQAGERVLDVCAAPGSKTTHIAALTGDRACIIAGDIYEHRLRLVRESAARQGLENIQTVMLDAARTPLPFANNSFARVLVDAPCTGTGTLRHNPEIRWRLAPTDIDDLAARQQRILAHAARTLSVGGRLVYSTCSIELEENEEVVAAFLEAHRDFVAVTPDLPAHLRAGNSVTARTWPHRDGTDGFFVAAFEKREGFA